MTDLILLAGAVALAATAVLAVACLRLPSFTSFLLAVFVVASAVTVGASVALSVVDAWTRAGMLVALGLALVGAALVWHARGRPAPPAAGPSVSALRQALRDPLVALPVAAVALGLVYQVVVALLIPPLDVDVLAYHLPRVVMWLQQEAVSAIPNAPGSNLDGNPPGAEIAKGVTMLLAGTDRYVGLVQVACVPAGVLGVAGVARRLGIGVRGAVFGGALFGTFPIVALQAPTAHNDLAVAVLLIVALYFLLGNVTVELALGSLALGLALSTKVSGILGLACVALVALVASAPGRRAATAVALVAGAALGSWWYAYNLWRTGAWDGHLGTDYAQVPSRAPDEILLRLERYLLQTLDLGGAVGRDRLVFVVVGAALVAGAVAAALGRRRGSRDLVVAGAIVAVLPWAIVAVHELAVRAIARSWIAVGRAELIGLFPADPETRPWPGEAWFGPAFLVLLVASVAAAAFADGVRRRAALLTVGLAAPALLFLVNAGAFVWDGARGRFFILAGGLAAATFGLALRWRPIAWAGAAAAAATLALSFVHFHARPAGIELFEPLADPTLWGEPRWRAQTALTPTPEAVASAQRLEEALARADVVAVMAGRFASFYPLMGAGPWRAIRFVTDAGAVPDDADVVAVAPGRDPALPAAEWERVPGISTWQVYRRVPARRADTGEP